MTEIALQVLEAESRDIGRYIVRITDKAMKSVGVRTGDVIQIEGAKVTAAIVWPAYRADKDRSIIRMDNRFRMNADVDIEDNVRISSVIAVEANYIELSPVTKLERIKYDPKFSEFVRKKLFNCPITGGDIVSLPTLTKLVHFRVDATMPSNSIVVVKKATHFNMQGIWLDVP